jgi:hypothetical protein
MWSRLFVAGITVYTVSVAGLFQTDVISGRTLDILEQYPPLAIVLIVVYYLQKVQREDIRERRNQQKEDATETKEWLERMLEIQRESLKEIYGSQNQFLTALLSQIETQQSKAIEEINRLSNQLAINTGTVSEIAKIDSIVSELIARLEKK